MEPLRVHRLLEGDARARASPGCWNASGCSRNMPGAIRTSFPAASGSVSALPARWR
jgi:hypothetical protein